ncbi:MAG: nucleotidyl transferase AbiEii/AbiGii toxin family protein [Patescibacteria group bacterium]
MILPKANDAIHRAWMYRILTAVSDEPVLNGRLGFKGGTCATMRGLLDRFSVDLDFDLLDAANLSLVKNNFEKIFKKLGLEIADCSKQSAQYFLKYKNKNTERNTLKIDCNFPIPKSNQYEMVRIPEIDRILNCQTVPTMFANKLIAVSDRYTRNRSIAGRDIFDIHAFFLKGFEVNEKVIQEKTGKSVAEYFKFLAEFIKQNVTQSIIDEDLNHLLPVAEFKSIRKGLKQEVLAFLRI